MIPPADQPAASFGRTGAQDAHRQVARLMQARDWRAAGEACRRLITRHPEFAAGWLTASRLERGFGRAADALTCIDRALALEPRNPGFLIHRGHCLLALGRSADAQAAGAAAAALAPDDPKAWDAIGGLFSLAGDQQRALAAYDRAVSLAPDDPRFIFNRAAVRRFVGALEGAECDYDRVIALDPADCEAYKNRADLRVQTAARNHVAELEGRLAQGVAGWQGQVQLRYALAKEYEDLGDYARSFAHLQAGAQRRREHLRYDVRVDVATVDWIIEAFPAGPASFPAGAADAAPIFIVGLPRSGSTLVERILGRHSGIVAAGEMNHFALAIVAAAQGGAPAVAGRPQPPRRQLIERSAALDFAALGRDYLERARAVATGRFTDKMPLNYLYCGLIRRALPNAKIVHVGRRPMAACYAMFKTLFKDGYPFSYDLDEIAQIYIAYRRLMDHWRRTMPGAIYSLSYESLIADQVGQTRRLLEFCGLDWQDACVQFHLDPSPTLTASASQVRRPLYDTSVSQWRHYEPQLAGLRARLAAGGIDLNEQ